MSAESQSPRAHSSRAVQLCVCLTSPETDICEFKDSEAIVRLVLFQDRADNKSYDGQRSETLRNRTEREVKMSQSATYTTLHMTEYVENILLLIIIKRQKCRRPSLVSWSLF